MTGSNRLLDNAFRSELERLSLAKAKTLQGRRRAEKRRSLGRRSVAPASEAPVRDVSEEGAMTRFFTNLIRPRARRALLLLVDASESMEQPSAATGLRKYDQACKLAAALSIVLRPGYDRIQIMAVGQARGNRSPVVRLTEETKEAPLQFLKSLRPGGKARFIHILQRHVKRLAMDTDCVVVSDIAAPEWEPGMELLLNDARIHTSLIHISDAADAADASAELFLASGGETENSPLDIDISRRLRTLLKDKSDDSIELTAAEAGDYLHITTDQSFERALITALEDR